MCHFLQSSSGVNSRNNVFLRQLSARTCLPAPTLQFEFPHLPARAMNEALPQITGHSDPQQGQPTAETAIVAFHTGARGLVHPAPRVAGQGVFRVVSDNPLVMEIEEGLMPDVPLRADVPLCAAEPTTTLWTVSEDAKRKWWRAVHPDMAVALEHQRLRGTEEATLHVFPRVSGQIYHNYKKTYVHDLRAMVQIDTDLHVSRPLRCSYVLRRSTYQRALEQG